MADIKAYARSADWVGDNRVVFNVAGNKYRLVVAVHFGAGIVLVKFVGTHAEYDAVDVGTVELREP
jgi:mRNA interferase HigB